jgi:hypothetical protein
LMMFNHYKVERILNVPTDCKLVPSKAPLRI